MRQLPIVLLLIATLFACSDTTEPGETSVTTSLASTTTTLAPSGGVFGTVTAGPYCPVVQNPPDPDCADRPVADARIVVFDASGVAVAQTVTSEGGMFSIGLAPGAYEVVAEPVPGLLGLPAPVPIEIIDAFVTVDLVYDTGIR